MEKLVDKFVLIPFLALTTVSPDETKRARSAF